jgi:hypothetical protein
MHGDEDLLYFPIRRDPALISAPVFANGYVHKGPCPTWHIRLAPTINHEKDRFAMSQANPPAAP